MLFMNSAFKQNMRLVFETRRNGMSQLRPLCDACCLQQLILTSPTPDHWKLKDTGTSRNALLLATILVLRSSFRCRGLMPVVTREGFTVTGCPGAQ